MPPSVALPTPAPLQPPRQGPRPTAVGSWRRTSSRPRSAACVGSSSAGTVVPEQSCVVPPLAGLLQTGRCQGLLCGLLGRCALYAVVYAPMDALPVRDPATTPLTGHGCGHGHAGGHRRADPPCVAVVARSSVRSGLSHLRVSLGAEQMLSRKSNLIAMSGWDTSSDKADPTSIAAIPPATGCD